MDWWNAALLMPAWIGAGKVRYFGRDRGKTGLVADVEILALVTHSRHARREVFAAQCMDRRALQEKTVRLGNGLASMYQTSNWSLCSGPLWKSARIRSH